MGLSETLGKIYGKAEDSFYSLMDFLQEKGIPVYSVIDPLEGKGIPVFALTIALIIILAALLYSVFLTPVPETSIRMDIRDDHGVELSGIEVSVEDEAGNQIRLEDNILNHGQIIYLKGIRPGSFLTVSGKKEGYFEGQAMVKIQGERSTARLVLNKDIKYIVGKIRLEDESTGDQITDATIRAILSDGTEINCTKGEAALFECIGVMEGEDALIKIRTNNYEDEDAPVTFFEETVNTVFLQPKPTAMFGKGNLIIRVKDWDTRELLSNPLIEIYQVGDDEAITAIVDDDGEYVEALPKGISVRLVVSREDYLMYDGSSVGDTRTIRGDEEIWEVLMKRGGESITVGVVDVTGMPLTNAKVELFNELGELIDSKTTDFSGQVVFDSLDPEATYYATAFLDRYLPKRVAVIPTVIPQVNIELERATAQNSATVEVLVAREDSTAANNAKLQFFELVEGEKLPLGLPQQITNLSGKYSGYATLGINLLVEAKKGVEEGDENKIIGSGKNELLIYLSKPFGLVLLKLFDEQANPITEGQLLIESGSGEVLYDENVTDGELYFDATDSSYVKLTYTAPDGSTYSEEINVEGKEEIEVTVKPGNSPGMTPSIEFKGIFTVDGKEIGGINKGEDYYAKFELTLPEGKNSAGIHVRVGADSVKYVDSQGIGITGFTASGATHFYGRTYSFEPEPGFEGVDFQNQGRAGEYNKWIELYFSKGGKKIVKVRIKAKETAEENEFELHYRAWTVIGSSYYRGPEDSILENEEFNDQRSGLYAEAYMEKIKLFGAKAICENELCASYKFIRADGSEYTVENFKAVKDERYALEIELNPSTDVTGTIKGSTSKTNPKLYFIGYGINNFAEFPDNNKTDTSIEVSSVVVLENQPVKARLYFRTAQLENASITTQLITGETVITETFYFNIYLEKNLVVKTEPEFISLGKDFSVVVKDEDSVGVENATIRISNVNGEIVRTIHGDGSRDKGQGGIYRLENSFESGKYKIDIRAEGFKPLGIEVDIAKTGILKLPTEVEIIIANNEDSAEKRVKVENSSDERIQDITFEIRKKANWPAGMDLIINPLSYIEPNSSQYTTFIGEYEGEENREHGEADIIVKGTILGKYPVVAETKAVIRYNPELDESCLEFSKEKLVVYLLGNAESAKELYLTIKNKCNLELTLTPEVVASGRRDEQINIELNDVILQPAGREEAGTSQDSQEVRIDVVNGMERNYAGKKVFKYDIFFKSDAVTKSIPLEVVIWDKRFALQVNRNIELWLATVQPGQPPIARVPLFVRNVGEADIENLTFTISAAYARGNVDIKIEPSIPIQTLKKGQSLLPPLWVVATALRTERATLHDVKQIVVKGTIDDRQYDFGPIWVNTHISPPECLQVFPTTVEFHSSRSKEGAMSKEITIKNTCAEDVRIRDVDPKNFGSNWLSLVPASEYLGINQETKAQLILTKREDWFGPPQPAFIKGFLLRSNAWTTAAPINIDIKLGENAEESKVASDAFELEVCEENGEEGKREKKLVRFPKIALTNNCDTAYCDAESLANFLVEKIEDKIRDAKRQVRNYNSEILNSNCDPNITAYCSFDRLGVKTASYDVYFMNDSLSPAMLRDVINKRSTELKIFRVDFVSYQTEPGSLLGGYGNQIFMNHLVQGCGRYKMRIDGAVRVQGTKLLPDYINILVNFYPEGEEEIEGQPPEARQLTDQCLPKIQNVMNFLPLDKSYSQANSMESWLGLVESEDRDLDKLGEEFAENLFESKQRFVSSIGGSNGLVLRKGTHEGYIIKLEMERIQGTQPMTIYADIMEASGEKQAEVTKEAAKAVKELRKNIIDGCISPNEDYFLIKSAKEIGKIEIEVGDVKLSVKYEREECIDFNILGDVREVVDVKARFKGERQGIYEPYIKKGDAVVTAAELSEKDEERNRFYVSLKLCAKGGRDIQFAQGKKVEINAESKANKRRMDSAEALLQVCGIHPYDLLEELAKKEKGDYYATIIWKNPPESITIDDLKKVADILDRAKFAEDIVAGRREPGVAGIEADPNRSARMKATLWGYLPACTVTALIIGGIRHLGLQGAVLNAFLDCWLPAGWVLMSEWDSTRGIKDWIVDKFKWLGKLIPKSWRKSAEKTVEGIESGEEKVPEYKELVYAAITEVSIHSAAHGVGATMTALTPANARAASQTVASNIAKEISRSNYGERFKALRSPRTTRLIESKLAEEIEDGLMPYTRQGIQRGWDEQLKQASKDALEKVGTDDEIAKALFDEEAILRGGGKEVMKTARGEVVDDIMMKANLEDVVSDYGGTVTVREFDDVGGAISSTRADVADTIKRQIIDSVGDEGFTKLPTKVNRTINNIVERSIREDVAGVTVKANYIPGTKKIPANITGYDVKIDESLLKRTARKASGTIKSQLDSVVAENPVLKKRVSQKVVRTIGSTADNVIVGGTRRLTGWQKFKRFISSPFKLSFWKSLIKEGLSGAIANGVGLFFYNQVYKGFKGAEDPGALGVAGSEGKMVDTDGDGNPDAMINITTTDLLLHKYATYHIRVDDSYVRKDLEFSQIDILPEDAKKENIIEKCDDESFKEGVENALPGLLPNPDTPPTGIDGLIHAKYVIAYIKKQNGYRYGALIASAVKDSEVPEALVVVVAIWKSDFGIGGVKEWITGCRPGDQATKKPQDSFKCAANSLNSVLKEKCKEGEEEDRIICTLEEYNKIHKVKEGASARDYDKLYNVYDKWNSWQWDGANNTITKEATGEVGEEIESFVGEG